MTKLIILFFLHQAYQYNWAKLMTHPLECFSSALATDLTIFQWVGVASHHTQTRRLAFPTLKNCFISLKPLIPLLLSSSSHNLLLLENSLHSRNLFSKFSFSFCAIKIFYDKENSFLHSLTITGTSSLPFSIIEHSFIDCTAWAHHRAFTLLFILLELGISMIYCFMPMIVADCIAWI